MSEITITLTPSELEGLIRRVVREELGRLADASSTAILHDWRHEGPDDPAGDEALAREAIELSKRYRDAPDELMSLEDFQEELVQAEAAGELPD